MRKVKEPIGSCECPFKGCSQVVPVYKYDGVNDDTARRRFAGKLYTICPSCGRSENQEFILNKIVWPNKQSDQSDGVPKSSTTTSAKPSAPVTMPSRKPQPKPQQSAPAMTKKSFWDDWGTVIK